MAGHKYKVGQSVRFSPRKGALPAGAQAYTIVRVLPAESDEFQYRIKSVYEAFERIARESELSALAV
jgi:hypothetical protein